MPKQKFKRAKNKKSTIDSEKISKKKHSDINSVKEYDKQTPEPIKPIISIKEKSFVEYEKD